MRLIPRGTGIQAGAAVAGQLISLGLLPVLTRLAPPVVFGGYAPFLALSVIGSMVGVARIEQITLVSDAEDDHRVVHGATLAAAVLGGAVVAWLAGGFLGRTPWEALAAGAVYLATVLNRAWILRSVRDARHGRIALSTFTETGGTILLQIGLLAFGAPGVLALLTGRAGALLLASLAVLPPAGEGLRLAGPAAIRDLVRRHRAVVVVDLPSSVANTVSWQSPVVVVAALWGDASAGAYSMAYRLLRMPTNLLGIPASRAFTSELVERTGAGGKGAAGFVARFTFGMALAGLAIYSPVWIAGEEFLSGALAWALGVEWAEAAAPTRILTPWLAAAFITTHLGVVFLRTAGLTLLLAFNLALLATRIGSFIVGGVTGDLTTMLWVLSISGVLAYALLYPLARRSLARRPTSDAPAEVVDSTGETRH